MSSAMVSGNFLYLFSYMSCLGSSGFPCVLLCLVNSRRVVYFSACSVFTCFLEGIVTSNSSHVDITNFALYFFKLDCVFVLLSFGFSLYMLDTFLLLDMLFINASHLLKI